MINLIWLQGAPYTGKTTLLNGLKADPDYLTLSYSETLHSLFQLNVLTGYASVARDNTLEELLELRKNKEMPARLLCNRSYRQAIIDFQKTLPPNYIEAQMLIQYLEAGPHTYVVAEIGKLEEFFTVKGLIEATNPETTPPFGNVNLSSVILERDNIPPRSKEEPRKIYKQGTNCKILHNNHTPEQLLANFRKTVANHYLD